MALRFDKLEANHGVSSKGEYKVYYDKLKRVSDIGFNKWAVRNSQSGMYDSPYTGNRLTNSFKIHYIRT